MTTAPVNKARRDWFWVLRTLMKHGVSLGEVGRATGRATSAVAHWQNGGEPKESDGRIVLALLAKVSPAEYRAHQAAFDIRVSAAETGKVL